MNDLMQRSLPKWPQMKVTGVSISPEQALEIIRRTDRFFVCQSGNNRSFIKQAQQILRIPQYDWQNEGDFNAFCAEQEAWEKKWGVISLNYAYNDWISSAFVYGPNGWCHPDGTIDYGFNIGKWPTIEEVLEDWTTIAKEFPFLNVGVSLMDSEYCEDNPVPVVSFAIKDGQVTVCDPKETDVHADHTPNQPVDDSSFLVHILNRNSENAIPLDILHQWAKVLD